MHVIGLLMRRAALVSMATPPHLMRFTAVCGRAAVMPPGGLARVGRCWRGQRHDLHLFLRRCGPPGGLSSYCSTQTGVKPASLLSVPLPLPLCCRRYGGSPAALRPTRQHAPEKKARARGGRLRKAARELDACLCGMLLLPSRSKLSSLLPVIPRLSALLRCGRHSGVPAYVTYMAGAQRLLGQLKDAMHK